MVGAAISRMGGGEQTSVGIVHRGTTTCAIGRGGERIKMFKKIEIFISLTVEKVTVYFISINQ
jgi:hypothetical protein